MVEDVLEAATIPLDFVETGWLDAATALSVSPGSALAPTPVAATAPAMPFTDVDPTSYYAEPVTWLVATGATAGTGPTTFSPDDTVTRGQLATFLWRLDGSPTIDASTSSFDDVDPAAFYAGPITWLAAVGITGGTSPTTFSPHDTVTRGQLATFLWRRAHPDG